MTLDEHIALLKKQAEEDIGASKALLHAGYYAHALFWAHLVLEKLCKAVWIKNNKSSEYPFLHNLIKILSLTGIYLTDDQINFYSDMNQFQSKKRYPDTLRMIEKTITKKVCEKYMSKTQNEIKWLLEHLQ